MKRESFSEKNERLKHEGLAKAETLFKFNTQTGHRRLAAIAEWLYRKIDKLGDRA
jgi:hypothetical protein